MIDAPAAACSYNMVLCGLLVTHEETPGRGNFLSVFYFSENGVKKMVFSTDYNQEEIQQEAMAATIPLALDWQEGWRW